jgi:hypothetical protein
MNKPKSRTIGLSVVIIALVVIMLTQHALSASCQEQEENKNENKTRIYIHNATSDVTEMRYQLNAEMLYNFAGCDRIENAGDKRICEIHISRGNNSTIGTVEIPNIINGFMEWFDH